MSLTDLAGGGHGTDPRVALGMDLLTDFFSPRSSASLAARPVKMTTLVDANDRPCAWPAIRRHVLQRDDWTCQACGLPDIDEVDHIFPRRWGGSDFLENLRAICGPCNKAKGSRADLEAAVFPDICGGFDLVMERIRSEINTYLVPALNEMADRERYEGLRAENVEQICQALFSEIGDISIQVQNMLTTVRVGVKR